MLKFQKQLALCFKNNWTLIYRCTVQTPGSRNNNPGISFAMHCQNRQTFGDFAILPQWANLGWLRFSTQTEVATSSTVIEIGNQLLWYHGYWTITKNIQCCPFTSIKIDVKKFISTIIIITLFMHKVRHVYICVITY